MAFTESKTDWKCPSDRELVLRAKVNVGWSIHSENVFKKVKPIPLIELESIENVIERAKELELMELERIGHMVCRLENMSRNVLGDGIKNCSMCGTSFGRFRPNFVLCYDCSKAVCEKCRIDTQSDSLELCTFCKICAENREVWKKSGGWFYGKLPTGNQTKEEILQTQSSGSPSSVRAYETWEHMAPDIVRMQSFEPPEENHQDHTLYSNWAVSSIPDLNEFEDDDIMESEAKDARRKSSNTYNKLEIGHLLGVPQRKLSLSCPSLTASKIGEDTIKRSRWTPVSKKRILRPARKLMTKITRTKEAIKDFKFKDTMK